MKEPVFLSLENVQFLHERSIERYGGTLGIRDRGGLEAAVNQPRNVFHYAQGDLYDMAAAYAFHITQARAFLDGNKRAAVATALAFLEYNDVAVVFDATSIYDAMIAIAEKRMTKSGLAALLREQAHAPGE